MFPLCTLIASSCSIQLQCSLVHNVTAGKRETILAQTTCLININDIKFASAWFLEKERKHWICNLPKKAHNRTSNSPLRMEGGRIILCNKCKISAKKIYCDDHSSLSSTAVQYEFHIYFASFHCKGRYELNELTSLPMCGFTAQLVEHRTGIAEVTGSNPVEALIFFGLLPSNCLKKKFTFFTFIFNRSTIWISYIFHGRILWRELYFSPNFSWV